MAKSDDRKVKRGVYLYIDGKEINNDITSIQAEIRQLTKDIKDMQIGSEEYTQTVRKIRTLRGILKEHKDTIRQVTDETKKSTISFGRFVDGFNRFGGFIASMVASLTGLILGLRSLRDEKNKLESSQASLKALTGLDDDSISWLTQQAQVLSTTMTKEGLRVKAAADEILDAYMLVGSAKPELLSDKEALAAVTEEAMRMQAAAGDITLAQAVDALTLSLNQYGAEADQAARYTNVLAAGSKEGAANIASQTAAIRNSGVAAASANVSFEETVALIQTLAYSGIKNEVAGTALKKFFLVLQTGADDVNPKIVGLSKALENLKAKNMGAADIKDMFGEEGYNAASVILQNIDMVNRYTEAVTGTSVAQEQAAINSATAEAKLAQVRNEMKLAGIELIEKLNPAIMVSTNAMTYVIKILPGLIDWFNKWGTAVMVISAEILVYNSRLKIMAAWHTTINALVKTATALKMAYAGAVALFTGNVGRASAAMRVLRSVINVSPWGLLLTAINAVGLAIFAFTQRTNTAKEAYKDFVSQSSKALGELKLMYNSIRSANEGTQNRIDLIKEFNSKYGQYLDNLLSEKSTIEEITTAYNNAAVAIKSKIAQETLAKHVTDIQSKAIEKQADTLDGISEILSGRFAQSDVNKKMQEIVSFTEQQIAAGNSVDNIAYGVGRALLKTKQLTVSEIGDIQLIMKKYAQQVKDTSEEVLAIENKLGRWLPKKKTSSENELPEVIVTPDSSTSTVSGTGSGTDDKNKFAAQEAEYYRQIAEIKKQYLEDSAMTQDEYNNRMLQAELKLLQDKLAVAGLEPEEQQKIMDQVLDARIKLRNAMVEQEKLEEEEKKKIQEQAIQDRIDLLDRQQEMEISELQDKYLNGLINEEEFQIRLRELARKYIDLKLQDTIIGEEQKSAYLKLKRDMEMDEQKKAEETEKERKLNLFNTLTDLGQGIATSFAEMFSDTEKSFGDFIKETIKLTLSALEKMMIMAVAERTIKNIGTLGVWGIAKSAGEIALITAAFETAKGVITGFADGGYTPEGPWDKPQGVVHSGEFVSNRFAVKNKHLRPVFDLIDQAQRAGSVANLTGDDIAAVVSSRPLTSSGTTNTRPEPVRKSTADPEMMAAIYGLIKVTGRLNKRLDEPFVTVNSVTGKGGIKEAMDEYDNLNSNKNRSTK